MKNNEKALLNFKEKAKKIILKHTLLPVEQPVKYSNLRLSGFFSNFNYAFSKVDEELSKESRGIINRYLNSDDVDVLSLMDGLDQYRKKARLEFIQLQQPHSFQAYY